jgi:hypothetical protein
MPHDSETYDFLLLWHLLIFYQISLISYRICSSAFKPERIISIYVSISSPTPNKTEGLPLKSLGTISIYKLLRLLHMMNVRFSLLNMAQRILGVTLPNF